jgi:hypothetical protein
MTTAIARRNGRFTSGGSRAGAIITRYRTRTVAVVRRSGRAVAKKAWERKALVAAPVVGFAMAKLHDMDVPMIPGIGKNGTIAVAATIAAVWSGNEWANHIAASALGIAAYELTRTGTLSGDDEEGIP